MKTTSLSSSSVRSRFFLVVSLFVFGISSFDSIYGQGTTYSTTTFVNLGTPGTGPFGIAFDSTGSLFVSHGHAIQKISPTGSISLIAGDLTTAGSANGTGSAAQFRGPTGIAIDPSGNIYVADTGNDAIRKISETGLVTTLAGFIRGSSDGTGIAAQFNQPRDIAADSSGSVYVVDSGNNALRRIDRNGTTRTLLSGSSFTFADRTYKASYVISGVVVDASGKPTISVLVTTPFGFGLFPAVGIAFFSVGPDGSSIPVSGNVIREVSGPSSRHSGALALDNAGSIFATFENAIYMVTVGRIVSTTDLGSGYPAALAIDPLGKTYIANPAAGAVMLATPLGQPPRITAQPQGATISLGGNVTLIPTVTGSPPFTYQWSLNGTAIAGATAASYPATFAGSYTVIVTNAAGSVTSNPAIVTIANRLANISTRAQVGADSNVEIAGFIISGPIGTTKPVLIRGVGPGLARLSVPGMLPQSSLTVFDSRGAAVATNTGWNTNSNAVQIATVAAGVGAFELQLNSADSALLLNLAPGAYTAAVSGVNGSTGVALAEVYEAASDSGQLVNISTRAVVGTGANIAISGIVVQGSQPGRFLIRGIGPALEAFGVTGVLADPLLTLTTVTGAPVATNDNWSENTNASEIAIVGAAAGAFPLGSGSRDAVLLVTLAPGSYTALVSGIGNSTGVALVEIYQVQ